MAASVTNLVISTAIVSVYYDSLSSLERSRVLGLPVYATMEPLIDQAYLTKIEYR